MRAAGDRWYTGGAVREGGKTSKQAAGGLSVREVAARLGLGEGFVRSMVRGGLLEATRGPGGQLRFSFRDLVLLRTAKQLLDSRIPAARIRKALRNVRSFLPEGRPLSGVAFAADGRALVVRDGAARWNAESGQVLFDFGSRGSDDGLVPPPKVVKAPALVKAEKELERAFERACALEDLHPGFAETAYRRILERAPHFADAHVNLGRVLQQKGQAAEAEAHYLTALALDPDDATACFNLGTVLEDQERWEEAMQAYARAIALDAEFADAHFNLARLYERTGQKTAALRHFKDSGRPTPPKPRSP